MSSMNEKRYHIGLSSWATANKVVDFILVAAVDSPALHGVALELLNEIGLEHPVVFVMMWAKAVMGKVSKVCFSAANPWCWVS